VSDAIEQALPEEPSGESVFAQIRQFTEAGNEYWSARDLAELLGYSDYRNFVRAVEKAQLAATKAGYDPADHFVDATEMVTLGSGAQRRIDDLHLTRYACYLIIQNADPAKEAVALGQTYFAARTHQAELADDGEPVPLSEAQRRLLLRRQVSQHHNDLSSAAKAAGVIEPRDFGIFVNHGYRGLYGGLAEHDIHVRKGLKPNQAILDHMNAEELAANLFRITQTEAKLRREGVTDKEEANRIARRQGERVRAFIAEDGGILPEDQPVPDESIKDLEKRELRQQRLRESGQLSMFDAPDEE
jgi:DNA-damage-inducible protein D